MKLKAFVLVVFGLVLGGCKANLEMVVNVSDLLNAKTKPLVGDIYLEVAGCSDYKDSRKPSKSVLKSKTIIPSIFPKAKYIECFRKEFKSYSHFKFEFLLDKDDDGKVASETAINIVSNKKYLLGIAVPKSIRDNLKRIKKTQLGAKSVDLNVVVKILNDTNQTLKGTAIAAYINDDPFVYEGYKIQPKSRYDIRMSDVSVDYIFDIGFIRILSN